LQPKWFKYPKLRPKRIRDLIMKHKLQSIIFSFIGLMGVQNAYAENEIYAVLNETDSIMTLRYDDQRVANSGVTDWSDQIYIMYKGTMYNVQGQEVK